METAILGYGVVGRATHLGVLESDPHVRTIDLDNRDELWRGAWDEVFVCLPTNTAQDLGYLAHVCRRLAVEQPRAVLIIRSTVPPGFISGDLSDIADRVIYFPEFIRERHWQQDSQRSVWVVGCGDHHRDRLRSRARDHEIVWLTQAEAEVLKIMANSFAALRVVFANHMHDLATTVGADYARIQPILDQVQHPGQDYMTVRSDLRGFGGRCLPKDLDLLIAAFQQQGLRQTLFNAVRLDNHQWPVTVRSDIKVAG